MSLAEQATRSADRRLERAYKAVRSVGRTVARPSVFAALLTVTQTVVFGLVNFGVLPQHATTLAASFWTAVGAVLAIWYSPRGGRFGGGGFGLPYGYGGVGYAPPGHPGAPGAPGPLQSLPSEFDHGSAVGMLQPTGTPDRDSPKEFDL